MPELSRIITALARVPGQPAALATLVKVEGSSYRRPGARLLVLADSTRLGSISGGCLEDDIVLRAERVLASGKPETAVYDTTSENDLVWGVGLGCQGVVRILIEPLPAGRPQWIEALGDNLRARRETELAVVHGGNARHGTHLASAAPSGLRSDEVFLETVAPPPSLVVFGAGDDAQPLVRMAKEIGWHVTVADPRAAYATTDRFPLADAVIPSPTTLIKERLPLDERTFAVIMTHRYKEDLLLLRALLPQPLAYLGLLGPHQRTERLLDQLRAAGFSPGETMLARLHAPVGLDLGGKTPETVALAILAEMQSRLTKRAPIHLRDRTAPIHG